MTSDAYSVPTHSRQELYNTYEKNMQLYKEIGSATASIMARILPVKAVVAMSSRIKDFGSFYEKANRLNDTVLKYPDPFNQIHDIVGIRIVVIARRNIVEVCKIIKASLDVLEEEDKAARLLEEGLLGYESYHFICRLGKARGGLHEYQNLCYQPFEIQVRTALQHAWAENEHRIQYKKTKNPELRKRFLRLAAAMSSADEEFDRIYEINEHLEKNAIAASTESSDAEAKEADEADENDVQLSRVSLLFGKKPSQLIAEMRYGEAMQVYDRFIAIQPKQVTHYVGRARARALAGDIDGGFSDLEVANTLNPDHPATKSLGKFLGRIMKDVNPEFSAH